jgi:hypothetical protein
MSSTFTSNLKEQQRAKRPAASTAPALGQPKRQKKTAPGSATIKPSNVIGVTRSISACHRCRTRKTRCDQKFPSCTACLKANVECVGIDAATGREIPRSYVSHLEDRVALLELELKRYGLELPLHRAGTTLAPASGPASPIPVLHNVATDKTASIKNQKPFIQNPESIDTLMNSVESGSASDASVSPSSYLGSSSGLSFARLLFTAVKFKSPDQAQPPPHIPDPTVRKSRPAVDPAPLPSKEIAQNLISIYFAQANPQLPILHREQFLVKYFKPIYGTLSSNISLASDYTSIGVPTCDPGSDKNANINYQNLTKNMKSTPALYFLNIIFGIANAALHQRSPSNMAESFHLAAMKHVDSVFASANRLEALQGILLLALYSIMRPAVPGVWYVLGSATRLCVDLGLHTESGMKSWYKNSHNPPANNNPKTSNYSNSSVINISEYDAATLDLRRRLFWCTYALDRQVCVYLGRPFGIPEHTIKVPFPSELDDTLIIDSSFGIPSTTIFDYSQKKSTSPSYKSVALSFFKIRKIHAEIQSILYECAPLPRQYSSLDHWRDEMAANLENWHHECPKSTEKMNCNFNLRFIELNYHQSKLLLYGLCPAYTSPPTVECYGIIAEAGKKIIQTYLEMNNQRIINYTWVVVHNLFMAGTSYLYALYHSPELRAKTTVESITKTTAACTEVLTSMIGQCDAATSCRDTFGILTAAILKLCYNEQTGVIMQLPNGQHVNNSTLLNGVSPLMTANVNAKNMHPHVSNLINTLPHDTEPPSESFFDSSTGFGSFGNTTWGDLDSFFKEAAQLDGISPNSASPDINKTFTEFQSGLAMDNIEGHESTAISSSGNYNDVLLSKNVFINSNNSQPRLQPQLQPQQSQVLPRMGRNDGQRIYDIINEVPMAAIWDQFFAPIPGTSAFTGSGLYDNPGDESSGTTTGTGINGSNNNNGNLAGSYLGSQSPYLYSPVPVIPTGQFKR